MRPKILVLGLALGTAVGLGIFFSLPKYDPIRPQDFKTVMKKQIPEKTTFVQFARELGVATDTALAILERVKKKYDLSRIVSGREMALVFNNLTGNLEELFYMIDSEEQLVVSQQENDWKAEVVPIPYTVQQRIIDGAVAASLYETFQTSGIDIRVALAVAEMFAWQIDFAADIREGDTFKVIYEERFLEGKYVMPGKILAAQFINDGEMFRGYYFKSAEASAKAGYYDEQGNSLQKIFLKSPLQYKYISSGFSHARYNPITKKVSPHRGIDYAAPAGTPAVAVGDGAVIQAGWNGYYGISVTIRHNEMYKTIYGHFSRLAKGMKVGAKVQQGQVVGYVGSTGLSTGPHLHYEMHKFGSHINPFKVEVPPGEPIHESDMPDFQKIVSEFRI